MNIPLIITILTVLALIVTILGINAKDVYRFIRAKLRPYPFPVNGEILKVYRQMEGRKGRLGLPISKEQPALTSERRTTGKVQRFAGNGDGVKVWDAINKKHLIGVSIYSSKLATCPVYGDIGGVYEELHGSGGRLGFPFSWERDAKSLRGTEGRVQRFEGNGDGARIWHDPRKDFIMAVSIYSSKKGTFSTWGSIGEWYEKDGGTGGRLGFPTSHEQQIHDNPKTWVQHFEGGTITCVSEHDPTIEYT